MKQLYDSTKEYIPKYNYTYQENYRWYSCVLQGDIYSYINMY